MPHIQVSQGTIDYRDEGDGPPVVFIHGLLVDGHVWDPVVAALSGRARCVVPELPLGSHRIPMADGADLTPPGLARLIAELLERLELTDVTLVANDTAALIVWGLRDRFFPVSDAERLEALLPYASLERIQNARTFVQLDAPDRLAELVAEMLPAGAPAAT
jgi:pimeloyl-ACP methyl ester carboxylesterase